MSRGERTVKDAAKLYGSQLLGGLFAVFFSAWLARNLPSAELSLWPVCITLSTVVQVLVDFGLGDLLVRLVPGLLQNRKTDQSAALLRSALLIGGLGALLLTGLAVLAAHVVTRVLLNNEVDPFLVRMLGAAVLFTALYKQSERALYAVQEFGRAATIRLVATVSRPSLAVALYLTAGIEGAIVALSVVPFAAFAAALTRLIRYLRVPGCPHRPLQVMRQALPFYGAALANAGTNRLDYLIVGALTTPASLAAYYVARQLADYLRQLDVALIEAITPKLSEQRGQATAKIEAGFTRCSRYVLLGLLPLHVGLAVTAPPIVALYAGDKYPIASPILSLLAVAGFVEASAGLHRAYVKIFGRRWHLTALDATSGLASVALTAALVLWVGTTGVPVAQGIAYSLKWVLGLVLLQRVFALKYDGRAASLSAMANGLLAVLAAVCMSAVPGAWSIPSALLLGVFGYFVALKGRLAQQDVDLLLRLVPLAPVRRIAGMLSGPAPGPA